MLAFQTIPSQSIRLASVTASAIAATYAGEFLGTVASLLREPKQSPCWPEPPIIVLFSLLSAHHFSPFPFRPRLIQLPLKRILSKPAHFLPEPNQLFIAHLAQFIPQLPQNFFG
jgi:hypothetical protein